MGIFKDMLYTGVRARALEDQYDDYSSRSSREAQDDYPSRSSRSRRVRYSAYCRICGAQSSLHDIWQNYTPGDAIRKLQDGYIRGTVSNDCGNGNHSPMVQEVEE